MTTEKFDRLIHFRPDANEEKSILTRSQRRKIFRNVLIAHVVIILVPFFWYVIKRWMLAKKTMVLKVQLVTSIPESQTTVKPAPPTPKPSLPEKKIETTTVATPKPKPKPKPKWKPRTAKDITVTKNVVESKDPAPSAISSQDIAKRLQKISRQCQVKNAAGPVSAIPAGYYDTIAAFLYERWQQPSRAELGGKNPTVTVTVAIDSSGRVKNSKISQKSGISVMDGSVNQLLKKLASLPKPPNGAMSLSISLEIAENF